MKYEKLSKRALGCMYVATALASVIALAVIGAVNWLWIFPKDMDMLKAVSLALMILILFDALASPYFRYHRYRYSINEECIDIKEGYLFVKRNIVPIERLHKLQTLKGHDTLLAAKREELLEIVRQCMEEIHTTAGGDVTIRFLEEEKAEQIAENLRGRINEIVVSQREEDGEEDGE